MSESLNNSNFFEFISTPGIHVVDFYAEWCEPCQKFIKIWDRVKIGLAEVGATIEKVDVDKYSELKTLFEVESVPCFLYFKGGKEVHRHKGILSIEKMKQLISSLDG
jgi:thioredoxin 1